MQVLHSIWDTETFHIWSESSALPLVPATPNQRPKKPLPHPFALTGTEVKRHLSGSFQLDGSDIGALTLQLPSGKGGFGPLPSPWLRRDNYVPQKTVGLVDCTITLVLLDFIETTTFWKSCFLQILRNSIADSTIPRGVSP